MCPLLARDGGHLRPLHHPRAGGERGFGVHSPGSLHPGAFKLHPWVRGGAQRGPAVSSTPLGSLVGWQYCVTAEQRVHGLETWVLRAPCQRRGLQRRLRGSGTSPGAQGSGAQLGRASLLAHCSRCAVGLCPMGPLQSPWADTSQKDFAGFAWTVGTVLGHYVCSHLLGWDTSPGRGSKRDLGGEQSTGLCLSWTSRLHLAQPSESMVPHPDFSFFCAGKA